MDFDTFNNRKSKTYQQILQGLSLSELAVQKFNSCSNVHDKERKSSEKIKIFEDLGSHDSLNSQTPFLSSLGKKDV